MHVRATATLPAKRLSEGEPMVRLAIPLAIPSLEQNRPEPSQMDGEPDSTCADAPRYHEADGSCLTSNP